MGNGEVDLELGPRFFFVGFSLTDLTVVLEHACGGDDVEGGIDDLDGGKRCIACGGELD